MKEITLCLYGIEELKSEAQETAFEKNRYINVEFNDWYDLQYLDFDGICESIGVEIPTDGIVFSGFHSQGDGSAFYSIIDLERFLDGIINEPWKVFAHDVELDFTPCPCDRRVLALLRKGSIGYRHYTDIPARGYWINFKSEYDYSGSFANIENELSKLDDWMTKELECLNKHLYETLENEYEYQISNEAIRETFISNDTQFTGDGNKADHLLDLIEQNMEVTE
ncbi:MAG: hypothetical protein KF704_02205 [Crocinitomicaceae bacterium]|nr:hypothetical protein [Crocinitomicaceae bacterium]